MYRITAKLHENNGPCLRKLGQINLVPKFAFYYPRKLSIIRCKQYFLFLKNTIKVKFFLLKSYLDYEKTDLRNVEAVTFSIHL